MARPALAATRAVEILNFLAAHPGEAFTLSDIVHRLDINVASTHAILAVLSETGYLTRHPRHRTYTLGPSLVAVGSAALEQHPAIDVARDEARRLSDALDLDVVITAAVGDEVVFVARSGTHQPRGVPTHVGQRMPLLPPLGAVYFAWSSEDEVTAWLERHPTSTAAAVAAFRAAIGVVRNRGYAVALEADRRRDLGRALEDLADRPAGRGDRSTIEVLIEDLARDAYQLTDIDPAGRYDVSSMAAPVFGPAAEVVLAVNLVGFAPALTGEEVVDYGERVQGAGLVVTKRTRGRLPEAGPG